MSKSILIADDHPIFRLGLLHLLQKYQCHEVNDGEQAVNFIQQHQPDLALLDINMPKIKGLDVLAHARSTSPNTQCIILTMYDDFKLIERAFDLGAVGYLLKEDTESELHECLKTILRGHRYLSNSIFLPINNKLPQPKSPLATLTPAEQRIIQLVAQFKTSREIASELGISIRTVQNHRSHISEKLGLKGSNALLGFAVNKIHLT